MTKIARKGAKSMERLLTVEQVADRLQLTPDLVRELLRRRKLRGARLGKYWRVREADLNAYIQALAGDSSADDKTTQEE